MEINEDILREAIIVYLDRNGEYDILCSEWYIKEISFTPDYINITIFHQVADKLASLFIEDGWWSKAIKLSKQLYDDQLRIERTKKINKLLD